MQNWNCQTLKRSVENEVAAALCGSFNILTTNRAKDLLVQRADVNICPESDFTAVRSDTTTNSCIGEEHLRIIVFCL